MSFRPLCSTATVFFVGCHYLKTDYNKPNPTKFFSYKLKLRFFHVFLCLPPGYNSAINGSYRMLLKQREFLARANLSLLITGGQSHFCPLSPTWRGLSLGQGERTAAAVDDSNRPLVIYLFSCLCVLFSSSGEVVKM